MTNRGEIREGAPAHTCQIWRPQQTCIEGRATHTTATSLFAWELVVPLGHTRARTAGAEPHHRQAQRHGFAPRPRPCCAPQEVGEWMLGDADTVSGTGASVDANTRSSISTLFLIPSIPGVIKQSRLCRRGRGISAKAIQARGWLDGTRLLTSRDYLYRFMYTDSRRCSCTRGFGPLPHHRHPRPHRPRHTLAAPLQGGGGGEGGGGEVAAMVAARGGRGGGRGRHARLLTVLLP